MTEDSAQEVVAGEDDLSDTDPDPSVLAGLTEQTIDLNTVSPEADVGDLAALQDVFADLRIVGLGEATHGAREFFRLKHRFVRFLVEELGFRLLALEANFTQALALDRYVRRGKGDPESALESLYIWAWQTEEMLALVEWLRAFNSNRPTEDQVRFYGLDVQHSMGVADAITDYLDRVDPEYLETVQEDLAVLADQGLKLTIADGRDERIEAGGHLHRDLKATLEEHRTDYVTQSSERAWELARQNVSVLGRAIEFVRAAHTGHELFNKEVIQIRDRALAENVAWILEHESADRIVVWAHNDHVNKVETVASGHSAASMGRHLAQWYGDTYYALGFEFGCGTFKAGVETEDERWYYKVQDCNLDDPISHTVGSVFTALDRQLTFLDVRTAKDDHRLVNWFDKEQRLNSFGSTYDPEHPEKHVQPYVLVESFDGLCYVNETTGTRPLQQG